MSKESKDTKSEVNEEVNASSANPSEVNVEVVDGSENSEKASEETNKTAEAEEDQGPVTLEHGVFKDLEEKAQKSNEYWDRFVRLNAEFDNFKKRAARERSEAVKYANEALMERLIPTMDHFEMAMAAVNNAQDNSMASIKMGIEMVHNQLKSTLKESGLQEIDALGKIFDPVWHEAVSQKETTDVPDGEVIEQARKGYKLNDRLIRPANVIVAKAPSSGESEEEAS
ncbi:MAG: nucleotide exchange factor GrpE [Verrucomicrobia bacterium]|jgi:molecular chaperone GrpE|nr:nucleotide exchange factor GrpE [Verrucomicrobiota bacterium]